MKTEIELIDTINHCIWSYGHSANGGTTEKCLFYIDGMLELLVQLGMSEVIITHLKNKRKFFELLVSDEHKCV
jgi:hypothetical protein